MTEQVVGSPGPAQKQPDRSLVLGLATATIVLSLLLKVVTGGWGLLIFGIPYLFICGIHFLVHSLSARSLLKRGWLALAIMSISDVLLLGAFLLQLDAGDGPQWLTITALTGGGPGYAAAEPPVWWAGSMSLAVFIPVLMSWTLMVILARRGENRAVRVSALVLAAGLGCVVIGLLVAVMTSHTHAQPAY